MLKALLSDDDDVVEEFKIPLSDQKCYIMRHISIVSHQAKLIIGNILCMHGMQKYLQECNEGIIFDLDAIPEYIVTEIYNSISYHIDKQKIT
jgi:hypothetical protein